MILCLLVWFLSSFCCSVSSEIYSLCKNYSFAHNSRQLVGISDSDDVEVLTFAGNLAGASATNGIGTTSQFSSPYGVSISPDGVYALVSETGNDLIRKIIITTADVSTFAGSTTGSTNGAGTSSQFSGAWGVTISPNGLYALVADVGNSLIRKIIITTASVSNFAGISGSSGYTNGAGTSSKLSAPRCVTISPDGVYALFAESGSQLIRKIVVATSTVSFFAGVSASIGSTNGAGTSSQFKNPYAVAISPDGTYALVADTDNHLIRKIVVATVDVSTFAGTLGSGGNINGIGTSSKFNRPQGVTISPNGIYALVADTVSYMIRKIVITTASVSTFAGSSFGSANGLGSSAQFYFPRSVAISPDGAYALVADQNNHLIRQIGPPVPPSPSSIPSSPPSLLPSVSPSISPSTSPSLQPSCSPSSIPSTVPSLLPSASPSILPSTSPSVLPSFSPSSLPSAEPSFVPSASPSIVPSAEPSFVPSTEPSTSPSSLPSTLPSLDPSTSPSTLPSCSPSSLPSAEPSTVPSAAPSFVPSAEPSFVPSAEPSFVPSAAPSFVPSAEPSFVPSAEPSFVPSAEPSFVPSASPSIVPSASPSIVPSAEPSPSPSSLPSTLPSLDPSTSPSTLPSSNSPSASPSFHPFADPSLTPSTSPSLQPSTSPSFLPSASPSIFSYSSPSSRPSVSPPTISHTLFPSLPYPSSHPSFTALSPLGLWFRSIDLISSLAIPLNFPLLYVDLGLKNGKVLGSCREFDVLVQDKISTSLISHDPVSVMMISLSGEDMMGIQNRSDLIELGETIRSVTCEEPGVVVNLLNDLKSLIATSSPSVRSHNCGGSEWSVMRCEQLNSLVLCVNCTNHTTTAGNYCDLTSSSSSPQALQFPFAISCADTSSSDVGNLSMLLFKFQELSPPPSLLSHALVNLTDTTVSAKVVMDGPGYLVCGAYLDSQGSNSSSAQSYLTSEMLLSSGGSPVVGGPYPSSSPTFYPSSSTLATYTLVGLIPSTSYNIYCASLSPTAVLMPTPEMLHSKMSFHTACCRSLYARLAKVIVDDVSVLAFALTLDVGSEVVEELLELSISGVEMTSSMMQEIFSPSHVTLSSSSSLMTALTYIPVPSGSYRLNVTLSGPAKESYRVVFPAGDVLVVKGVEVSSSPPSVQRSEFSSDGSKIKVTFNSPTNRGRVANVISCGSLFKTSSLTSHALSPSARCVWTSDSSLEISSIGALIGPGDLLEVRSGVLKARCTSLVDPSCSSWKSNDSQNTTLSAPSVVKSPPVVTVSLPSEMGPCDDLVVDLTSSSGSGGRPWKSVSFLVRGLSPNISSVQSFFSAVSTNPSSVRSPLVLPNEFLNPGFAYSLETTLCNFLGACGLGVKGFVVSSSNNVPVVLLNSRDTISIFRNATLSISGDGYTSVCGGGKSRGDLSFSWSLSENNVPLTSSDKRSVSVNPREFKLPAYRLTLGSLYKLTLTAKHLKSLKYSSASVTILIRSGDLVCLSTGGNVLGLRLHESLSLDMSRSYDSNVDPNSNPQPLTFELRCFQTSPSYRDSCVSLIFSSFSASPVITVTANSSSAEVGAVFQIVMRGRSSKFPGVPSTRSCEKAIQITILASQSPVVKLDALSGLKMNPSSKLKILGRVDMGSSGEVQWSVDDDSIVLSSVSLSPLSRSLPPSFPSSPHVLSLVVIGNSLPQQSSFVFTLTCSLGNGYSSSSSVVIITNSPPFGGMLEVSPATGVMLQTMFLMVSSDWVDEDLPLSYQFGYLSSSSTPSSLSTVSTSKGLTVIRSKLQLSSVTTLLPTSPHQDPSESPANLTCVAVVFDQMDSSSRSLFGVLVIETKLTVDDLSSFLLNGINFSRLSDDSNELKSALSSTTAVLNRVNCSSAPDCVPLNRIACSSTEGTCGECLAGYFGLIGSSNTPCLSSGDIAIHRSLLPSSSSLLSAGSSSAPGCHSDADCVTNGWFQECNLRSNLCQSVQQTCPNSCSGHGRCVFSSRFDLNKTVDECGLLDVSCVSRCECEGGFMGSSCSLGAEDFQKRVDLRHLMLENVRDLMEMENAVATNVKSWMRTLSSVSSSDYLGLTKDSKILMSSLVIDILRASVVEGLSVEDLREAGMDAVVDMCVSGLSSSFTTEGNDGDVKMSLLMTLLRGYSDFVTSDMLQAQDPVTSVNPFLRSSSFALSSTSLTSSSSSLSLPQLPLESLGGLRQHSISVPTGLSLPLQISLSETLVQAASSSNSTTSSRRLSVNANGTTAQLSLPLFVSLGPSSFSSGDCIMRVLLQHKPRSVSLALSPSPSPNSTNTFFEVDCVMGIAKDYEFTCSSGEPLVLSCNGSVSGRARRYCPMRSLTTVCESTVTSSSVTSAILCTISPSESNETVTTCLCNLSSLGSLDDSSGGSVSFSLLSIEKSVVTEFVSTWETVPSLSSGDVTGSWVVLVTVGGVGLSFLLMVLGSIQSDKQESRQVSSVEIETKHKHGTAASATNPLPGDLKKSTERQLIEAALPSIFKSDSLWIKFKEEVKVYHRWLGIIFYYSPEFPRAMRVLSLFSSIVIMLFIQSVTYNIADPDDGSCENCDNESCCLSLRSTLNSNEDRCFWKSSSPDGAANFSSSSSGVQSKGSCHFRDIGQDMVRMFIVAMISAVVSAPLALSVQYLIMNVLSKQSSLQGEEAKKEKQRAEARRAERAKSSRRLQDVGVSPSLSSSDLVEVCGTSLLKDLDNLLGELLAHYAFLVAKGKEKENQAKEFRGAWGSLVKERSSGDIPKLLKVSSGWARFASSFSMSSLQHEEVTADLVTELGKVRNSVLQEYQRLEGLGVAEEKKLAKRKRLLYLFVKDLTRGMSGEVLSSKSQRDSQMSRGGGAAKMERVSWWLKLMAGVFVALLDIGMLFYVYLFAMNQTSSRQQAWFISFVMWLGFEIFLSSTALVLVLHLLVPLYVWSDVSELKKRVLSDLMKFRERYLKKTGNNGAVSVLSSEDDIETGTVSGERAGSTTEGSFNAAKYLFRSWRVASLFPEIPESRLVLQFSTPWPKKKFGKEEGNVAKEYEDDVLLTAASRILLYFLTSLLNYNSLVQDIVIQTVCNSGLGSLCVLLIQLWNVYPWLAVVVVVAVLLCVYGLGRYSLSGLAKKLQEEHEEEAKAAAAVTKDANPEAESESPLVPSVPPTPLASLHVHAPPPVSPPPVSPPPPPPLLLLAAEVPGNAPSHPTPNGSEESSLEDEDEEEDDDDLLSFGVGISENSSSDGVPSLGDFFAHFRSSNPEVDGDCGSEDLADSDSLAEAVAEAVAEARGEGSSGSSSEAIDLEVVAVRRGRRC